MYIHEEIKKYAKTKFTYGFTPVELKLGFLNQDDIARIVWWFSSTHSQCHH